MNNRPSPGENIPPVGSPERKDYYDFMGWNYDDTITIETPVDPKIPVNEDGIPELDSALEAYNALKKRQKGQITAIGELMQMFSSRGSLFPDYPEFYQNPEKTRIAIEEEERKADEAYADKQKRWETRKEERAKRNKETRENISYLLTTDVSNDPAVEAILGLLKRVDEASWNPLNWRESLGYEPSVGRKVIDWLLPETEEFRLDEDATREEIERFNREYNNWIYERDWEGDKPDPTKTDIDRGE